MGLNLEIVKLPKKIDPCPIIEAIVELRFNSPFPHDAIFGIIYKEFKDDYPTVEELPILQLPESVRRQDPNLSYKPYYKLSKNDKFLFQVGARVISLISLNPYAGWNKFYEELKDMLQRIRKLEILSSYNRVGIRYINGFEGNIFEKVDLSLNMRGKILKDINTSMRLEMPTGKFVSTLRIANNVQITIKDKTIQGSIIDIDTFIENPVEDELGLLDIGHIEEKKLFFTLLKEDFLKHELNPEY